MRMTRWCLITVLGASLLGAGCHIAETSEQEDLGRDRAGHAGSSTGWRCAARYADKYLFSKRTGDSGRGWGLCASGGQWHLASRGA